MTFGKILKSYVAQQQRLSQSDAFLNFADRQTPAPIKARQRATAKRAATAAEKREAEREQMARLWRAHRAERVSQLLEGPYGKAARELIVFLGAMTPANETALIDLVKRGPWRTADTDTRFEVLSLINAAITTLRERAGLPPFNDALHNEKHNAFLTIRELLR
jgi:hypothetical protein